MYFRDGSVYFRDGSVYFRDGSVYFRDGSMYFRDGRVYFTWICLVQGWICLIYRWICSDNCTCCHPEIGAGDQTCYVTQTLGPPVLALTLKHQVPVRVAARLPVFKSLIRLDRENPYRESWVRTRVYRSRGGHRTLSHWGCLGDAHTEKAYKVR